VDEQYLVYLEFSCIDSRISCVVIIADIVYSSIIIFRLFAVGTVHLEYKFFLKFLLIVIFKVEVADYSHHQHHYRHNLDVTVTIF